MNRCYHGYKITKFCVTEHCQHKECGGCEYCIKKHHCHLTNMALLSEEYVDKLLRALTMQPYIKISSRAYQYTVCNYLNGFKSRVNVWVDEMMSLVSDQLYYPMLKKYGILHCYNQLKNREFRKLNGKYLRMLSSIARTRRRYYLEKEEYYMYFDRVYKVKKLVGVLGKVDKELEDGLSGEYMYVRGYDLERSVLNVYYLIVGERVARELGKAAKSKKANLKGNEEGKGKEEAEGKGKSGKYGKYENIIEKVYKESGIYTSQKYGDEQLTNNYAKIRKRKSSIDNRLYSKKFGQTTPTTYDVTRYIEQRKYKLMQILLLQKTEPSRQGESINLATLGKSVSVYCESSRDQKETSKSVNRKEIDDVSAASDSSIVEEQIRGVRINNVLPPLHASIKRYAPNEEVKNKVIHIPINAVMELEEVHSPILNKRRQSRAEPEEGKAFGIFIQPVQQQQQYDSKEQEQKVLGETDKDQLSREGQVEALMKASEGIDVTKFTQYTTVKTKLYAKYKEKIELTKKHYVKDTEDTSTVLLALNYKNSLLLFSEALKADAYRAIVLLQAALKYAPNNLSAAEYLSYLYLEMNRTKYCLDVCDYVLSQIADRPEYFELTLHLHNNKAAALNLLGRYSYSIVVLEKCLKYRRKDYFYKNLGDAYFSLGIQYKAILNYEKSLKLNNQFEYAHYNLAVCLYQQQEYSLALHYVYLAIRGDGSNTDYRYLQDQVKRRIADRQRGMF